MRFVNEYANYKKKIIRNDEIMYECYKSVKVKKIDTAVSMFDNGFITVDEAMKEISEA